MSWGSLPAPEVTYEFDNGVTRNVLHGQFWWAYQFTGRITINKDGSTAVSADITKSWSQQYDANWGPGTSRLQDPSAPYKDIFVTTSFDFASGVPPLPEQPWGADYGRNSDFTPPNSPYSDFKG